VLAYASVIVLLHALGWGLFMVYGGRYGPAFAGAGSLAYVLGLRHAFDADHIAAVDDTTRLLLLRGERPLGVGFYFSLGHSTVVCGLAIAITAATRAVQGHLPAVERVGRVAGATISGTFLLVIAVLDLVVFLGILEVWRQAKRGVHDSSELDDLMSRRGFMNRVLGSRWRTFVRNSRQMYFVGLLFGLGFDTASEVAMLAVTAAAAGNSPSHRTPPWAAMIALPLLFTAGMSLMDTTDGVFMTKAYDWAFRNPIRKVYYNLATVGLGVLVAGLVGSVEYLQLIGQHVGTHGAFWSWVYTLNFEALGYVVVATSLSVWLASVVLYKARRIEQRYGVSVDAL
jgi:high-affinity nickel-transport protein